MDCRASLLAVNDVDTIIGRNHRKEVILAVIDFDISDRNHRKEVVLCAITVRMLPAGGFQRNRFTMMNDHWNSR